LGEAASHVSQETTAANAEVTWALPVAMRNRIVHGYWSIDLQILHTTASAQLPTFVAGLERVLASLD